MTGRRRILLAASVVFVAAGIVVWLARDDAAPAPSRGAGRDATPVIAAAVSEPETGTPIAADPFTAPTAGDFLDEAPAPGAAGIAVQVVDEDDVPVAGARITAAAFPSGFDFHHGETQERLSDRRGRRFIAIGEAACRLHAGKDGSVSPSVDVEAGAAREVVLVLVADRVVRGVVLDAAGAPVADAQVGADPVRFGESWPLPRQDAIRGVAGAGGRFQLALRGDGQYEVFAWSGELVSRRVHVVPATQAGSEIVLRLPGRHRITGTLFAPDGRPSAGTVSFHAPDAEGGEEGMPRSAGFFEAKVDDEGRIEAIVPSTGIVRVIGTHPDFCSTGILTIELGGASSERRIDLHLRPKRRIAGRVVDLAGRPIGGATVEATPDLRDDLALSPLIREVHRAPPSRSDSEGNFAIDGLHPDHLYLIACRPGLKLFETGEVREHVAPGTADLEIRCDTGSYPVATVKGKLVGDASGRPVEEYEGWVEFLNERLQSTGSIGCRFESQDGAWSFVGVRQGTRCRLWFRRRGTDAVEPPWSHGDSGFWKARTEVFVVPPEGLDLTVRMPEAGRIEASVADADGRPAPNVQISLRWEDDPPHRSIWQRTDRRGVAAFETLEPGRYELRAARGGAEGPVRVVTVTSGGTASAALLAPPRRPADSGAEPPR